MIVAIIDHVVVTFYFRIHAHSIADTSNYIKVQLLFVNSASSIPMHRMQGFYDALDKFPYHGLYPGTF